MRLAVPILSLFALEKRMILSETALASPAIMNQNADTAPRTTEQAGPPLPLFGMDGDRIPERIGKFRILDLVARHKPELAERVGARQE